MIAATVFAVIVPVNLSGEESEPPTEEWVARYNGPGNGIDNPHAIAVDKSGNVYVTGSSSLYPHPPYNEDYVTIKYDSEGNELWKAQYNGPCNSKDGASDIVVDDLGNVYVTGTSDYGTADYVTIKYDAEGNELWVARYDNQRSLGDIAHALAVDDSGNVYVTGNSGGVYGYDYATVKYDPMGNELWVVRYNGPAYYWDFANDIALDKSGNVYVTGNSYGIRGTNDDYATVKYDQLGNELWVARYNGPGNYRDFAKDIALDNSGNVYVTGNSYGSGTERDYATVAYDPNGNELWVGRYNGPANSDDWASAIGIDDSSNIYVTGTSYEIQTEEDYATVAYDSSGNQLWVARYNGPANSDDGGRAIHVDDSGNVYVTGTSYGNGTKRDYTTIKYDPVGNELWMVRYNGPANDHDRAQAMTVDDSGNVYVTGRSYGSGTYGDFTTIKYSQFIITTVNVDPDTLNLKSKGRWITCYIELPDKNNVNDIDLSTVLLEDIIPAEWGDVQGTVLMVKFDRSEVEDMLSPGTYNLRVTGELTDGTAFEGYSDEIRIIDPP